MNRSILLLTQTILLCGAGLLQAADIVVDFEDLSLPVNGSFIGDPGVNTLGIYSNPFTSRSAGFNNTFEINNFGTVENPAIFKSWSGWGYSRTTDITTPGYDFVNFVKTNEMSAFNLPAGGGADGSLQYGVATFGFVPSQNPVIELPDDYRATSIQVANTTYAAISMRDGDPPGGFARKFGTDNPVTPATEGDDWFLLKIIGRNDLDQLVGNVDFYLADYRNANNALDYIIDEWTTVDLSSLTAATKLTFALSSSDNSAFGINTPAYFAIDNLTLTAVPEPGSIALLVIGGIGPLLLLKYSRKGAKDA